MTISSSRTRELDINTIVKRAMQLGGLMEPGASTSDPLYGPKRELAMDLLDTICKSLQNEAVIDRHVLRATVAVVGGVSTPLTLSTSAMTLLGKAMYVVTGEVYETPVRILSIDEYHVIGDKTIQARPSTGYFARQPTPTLTLWPVPEDSGTLTYEYHTLVADVSVSTDTLDFERHWEQFFIWELAHQLLFSSGIGLERVSYARSQAQAKLETAKAYSRSPQDLRFRVTHKTPWTR